ncbi:MAG: formylglycine-generating enzyme family protein [Proteobacteria bacterium]|nr:formylglycine-generating enzyme family protein [Pseudomonadota bacterium]MBU1738440.1 formylglycine-generating enzyme family protein [Pseudomonadota bacterium]
MMNHVFFVSFHILLFVIASVTTAIADGFWQDPATGMEFTRIQGGCFQMGQGESEKETLERLPSLFSSRANFGDELPRHEVCVGDYALSSHEVTVAEFRTFTEETAYRTDAEVDGGCMEYPIPGYRWKTADRTWLDPGFRQKDNEPVVCVSYYDAVAFANWLSEKDGKRKFRLPTEAEWEYAVREGGGDKVYGAADELGETGWFVENSPRRTSPVATGKANALGISDLNGNVWEWVGDTYAGDYYRTSPRQNPTGAAAGPFKVVRGGSWNSFAWHCRAANREFLQPVHRDTATGFRLLFTE